MQTIVINNQKGGVGKTTLAIHLAWFLAEQDKARILFIDLDAQANATGTLRDERKGPDAASLFDPDARLEWTKNSGLTLMPSTSRLHHIGMQNVAAMLHHWPTLEPHFDYCIIDTPPTGGARNFAAIAVSDHLIAPIEIQAYSIEGISQLMLSIEAVERQAREGRKVNFLGLLPSRYNTRSPREQNGLSELVATIGPKGMFPGILTYRDSYAQAASESLPVWKIKKSAAVIAATEIRGILSKISDAMNVAASRETERVAI